jgi:Mce-associated membrane protein
MMTERDQVMTLDADSDASEPAAGAAEVSVSASEDDAGRPMPPVDEQDSDVPATRWRRPKRRTVVVGAGALLLAAAVATAATLGWQVRDQRAVDDAAAQALAAAQQYAVVLTTVDAAKLDSNFATVLDGATGEFKDMYSQSSAGLKQVLVDNKAKATGTVLAAGIKSATPDKVEVLLFVDQAVTNALNPEPRLDRNRIVMTMEKINGRWLASDVELP